MQDFSSEFQFSASRSGGPGGQNVNKVSTKVELRFDIHGSLLLSEDEKALLISKLVNKINSIGELIIVSQSERSQLKNREKTVEKFYILLEKAFTPAKKRKKSKPTQTSIEKRLKTKQIVAKKKVERKNPDLEH